MSHSPIPWLSVVIPIKDERDNIQPLANQLIKVLGTLEQSQETPFEILFVDDGSTDGSGTILDGLAQEYPEVQVLHLDRNHGQTAAFHAGFRQSRGRLLATIDGDLQYDPADIPKLLPLMNQYDLVCGHRQQRLDNLLRKISSHIAYLVRNAVIHDGILDTGCSLKLFRREVLERIPWFRGMHRFFPALAQMYGFSVIEAPVQHFPRAHGQSKYGIGNRLFAGLYDLIAVRWMQSRCFRYKVVKKETGGLGPHQQ